jgi:threonine/homoserine/homoserine lactone efflux protein
MTSLFLTAIIILLAAISPGPDFIVVMKNAISHEKKAGLWTSLGISLGNTVHVTYCIIGIGAIITRSIIIFQTIKIGGALYLLYLAYKLIRAPKTSEKEVTQITAESSPRSYTSYLAEGFRANVLNPKATVFILSLFTQAIPINASLGFKLALGAELVGIVGLWFCILSLGINTGYIQQRIHGIKYYVEKTMGVVLAGLGLKVLLSR